MPKIITSPTIHRFESTSEAYDICQGGDVADGDVLIVESERVVGFLCAAWPCAVTPERGAFHTLALDVDITCLGKRDENVTRYEVNGEPCEYVIPADPGTDYTHSVRIALAIAAKRERYAVGDVVVLFGHADGENGPHESDLDQPIRVASVLEVETHSANPEWVLRYRVSEREPDGDVDVDWIKPGTIHRLYVPELDDERVQRALAQLTIDDELAVCEWFALCTNPATGTLPHPVLGEVLICDRCRAKYEATS